MSHRPTLLAGLLLLCTASTWLNAEVISIGKQSPEVDRSQLPQRGMSMAKVSSHYGEPVKKSDSVGNPPITKWTYDHYTVYFEHQHVVQAVVHAKPSTTTDALPAATETTTDAATPTDSSNTVTTDQ
jgi:hypothetical protein